MNPADVHRVGCVRTRPGSKGVSVAAVVAQLGEPVVATRLADEEFANHAEELGPQTAFVHGLPRERSTVAIVETARTTSVWGPAVAASDPEAPARRLPRRLRQRAAAGSDGPAGKDRPDARRQGCSGRGRYLRPRASGRGLRPRHRADAERGRAGRACRADLHVQGGRPGRCGACRRRLRRSRVREPWSRRFPARDRRREPAGGTSTRPAGQRNPGRGRSGSRCRGGCAGRRLCRHRLLPAAPADGFHPAARRPEAAR